MTFLPTQSTARTLIPGGQARLSPALAALHCATGLDPRQKRRNCTLLLLDTSASMHGTPLSEATEGALQLNANCLSDGQQVGFVAFGSDAQLIAAPSHTGIAQSLQGLRCAGSTNMAAAINLGITALKGVHGRHTLVLATDGFADDPTAALIAAKHAKAAGVRLLTIGTTDCDTEFLAQLSSDEAFAVVAQPGALGKAIAASAQLLLT